MGVAVRARNAPTSDLEFREVVTSIRRGKWIVLLAVIFGSAAAYTYIYESTPLYTATAEVLVQPVLTSPSRPPEPLSMQTESLLVTSTAVTDEALTALGADASDDVADRVSVDVLENTEILTISFTDPDPQTARRGAQAFADAYLALRGRQAADAVAQYAEPLREQISDLDRSIEEAERRIASLRIGSPRWQTVLERRSDLEATRLALLDQLAPITTMSTHPGEIVSDAQVPSAPSSPKRQMSIALGVTLGLLVGVGLAYVVGAGRRTRRSSRRSSKHHARR
jgi:uncharacterized protein involved in exopolysaccharide biosynthesis